jgi:hypothetical protein
MKPEISGQDQPEIERDLLGLGFEHVGSFKSGKLEFHRVIERDTVGVYVMVLDGRAFNIGESKSVRDRLRSYEKWLRTRFDKDHLERHRRERSAQGLWEARGGMGNMEIYVRPSDTCEVFGVPVRLNKAEEAALIERFRPICNWREPKPLREISGQR